MTRTEDQRDTAKAGLWLGQRHMQDLAPGLIGYPLVSFVLRNWNHAHFVGKTIDSIRGQTYPNFEAIVVDNGSTDNSIASIQEAIGDDPRFRTLWLNDHQGALGGALKGLDLARGDFVVFVDSDDFLFADFAATHVQVHLALPHSLAFTSSDVFEVDAEGQLLSGARLGCWDQKWGHGLRNPLVVPRLSEISDAGFETLHRSVTSLPAWRPGWMWAPGTANMFRRFIIEAVRPQSGADVLFKLSTDGHFCRLAHALGGSALIGVPLSAYRLHGKNFFGGNPAIQYFQSGNGPAADFFEIRRREAMRVLVSSVGAMAPRMGNERFWLAVEQVLEGDGASARETFQSRDVQAVISENLSQLVSTFGAAETFRNLRSMMSQHAFVEILRSAGGGIGPMSILLCLIRVELSSFFLRRKRWRRLRRLEKRARQSNNDAAARDGT